MGSRILDLFRLGRCSHEFSWPRRWPDGEYYQVCLVCGEEYRYDWKTMSRLERITARPPAEVSPRALSRQGRACSKKKPSWSPRARRIKLHDQEMKFRVSGSKEWQQGHVQNISQTGILFRPADTLTMADNAELEMILEMPPEIIGQEHAQVIAHGLVVRMVPAEDGKERPGVAAGIWEYRVLHERRERPARVAADMHAAGE